MTALALLEATQRATPRSHAVAALADHGRLCAQCRDNAAAGLPIAALCGVGRALARRAMRGRARRSR